MATIHEQMKSINNKNEMIKWLINEYFILSNKAYGNNFKEIINREVEVIKNKADELMRNKV